MKPMFNQYDGTEDLANTVPLDRQLTFATRFVGLSRIPCFRYHYVQLSKINQNYDRQTYDNTPGFLKFYQPWMDDPSTNNKRYFYKIENAAGSGNVETFSSSQSVVSSPKPSSSTTKNENSTTSVEKNGTIAGSDENAQAAAAAAASLRVTLDSAGTKNAEKQASFEVKQYFLGNDSSMTIVGTTNEDDKADQSDYSDFENPVADINDWWYADNETEPDCSHSNARNMKSWRKPKIDESNLWPGDCDRFKIFWSYPFKPMSHEEAEYPLAYVFMSHRNLHQTLRLFRAIYHPQNVYCVNWDKKSADVYKKTMENMASCFDNVFYPKEHRNIYWCHNSILRATMDCMEILHKSKRKWRYVQIVSWNDFPLKSNLELVQIFKELNGSVDSDLEHPRLTRIVLNPSNKPNPVPPGGLVLYKGTYAATMPREFVDFVFQNRTAMQFYDWLDNTRCGEEYFWATLAHNRFLKAPGHFPGSCIETYDHIRKPKPWISRYQLWEDIKDDYNNCKGKMVLYSCVYGVENVEKLKDKEHLMAHKFYEEIEPAALYCMEKWHYAKTYNRSRLSDQRLNYYRNMHSSHRIAFFRNAFMNSNARMNNVELLTSDEQYLINDCHIPRGKL
uniref:Uncharacterized protein n=1 Tax=Romanomermis culicivorax TaxID=13658 RepID=A0A915KTC6_ROMCU